MTTKPDLTQPPPHRRKTKQGCLMDHLPRIEEAIRVGWSIPEIHDALNKDACLDVSLGSFRVMLARARRHAAALAAGVSIPSVPKPNRARLSFNETSSTPPTDTSPETGSNPVALESCVDDLDHPPPYWKPTKLSRLIPHLPRIDRARQLGWRMVGIQAKLTAELDLGEMSPSAFSALVAAARRRAARQP